MADANNVLRALACHDRPLTAADILAVVEPECSANRVKARRKKIIGNLGCLMQRKLAERVREAEPKQKTFGDIMSAALYRATDEGRKFVAEGKRVTCARIAAAGPKAVEASARQQRFWAALRQKRKATIADLVELTSRSGEEPEKLIRGARDYLKWLCRAGVITRLPVRAAGYAPSSNGFVRYALAIDLGPRAPVTGKHAVFNPNDKSQIPYRDKPKEPSRRKAVR